MNLKKVMLLSRYFKQNWLRLFLIAICLFLVVKVVTWHWLLSAETKQLSEDDHKAAVLQSKKSLEIPFKSVRTGLTANDRQFRIDGKPITIISGAVHYFRFPQEYWEDRLLKMKACGLNTIETYVPWNLHEPMPGKFDFGGDLNLSKFLQLAESSGFYVLLRPGPYICSEWEFGGLPSWLLRDQSMKVRTMHPEYIKAVTSYFKYLLSIVKPFQYKNGGPIIAFQLDNEYGAYFKDDKYIPFLKKLMEENGIKELFFVSDGIEHLKLQTVPDVLKTVNFKYVENRLNDLQTLQPDAPLMVMEFWTGWFDWWGEKHHTLTLQDFSEELNKILSAKSSVNFYMFFGGTNFGFMNGGFRDHTYKSDITSYDYDALIAENGDLTPKYFKAKQIIAQYYSDYIPTNVVLPASKPRIAYNDITLNEVVSLWDVLELAFKEKSELPKSMEMLDVNHGAGQSYGYVLYSTEILTTGIGELTGLENVNDRGILFIDRVKVKEINERNKKEAYKLSQEDAQKTFKIDLLVENGGRINWLEFDNQRKGLVGPVFLNGQTVVDWTIYSFEMRSHFIKSLFNINKWSKLSSVEEYKLQSPSLFRATLEIYETPSDTYLDMSDWGKGVVFVNGKNLGRYWSIGPQITLYLPAPWLKVGKNDIVIFEESKFASSIKFVMDPRLN